MAGVSPNLDYMPTIDDLKSLGRIMRTNANGVEEIFAVASAPEESPGIDEYLPELSLFCIYTRPEGAPKRDRYALESEAERRVNASKIGEKWWTYVLFYKRETIEKNDWEARKIPDGATLVWPLEEYGTRSYKKPPKKENQKGGKRTVAEANE